MKNFRTQISFEIFLIITLLASAGDRCWGMEHIPPEHITLLPKGFKSLPENLRQQHIKLLQEHADLQKQHEAATQEHTELQKTITEHEKMLQEQKERIASLADMATKESDSAKKNAIQDTIKAIESSSFITQADIGRFHGKQTELQGRIGELSTQLDSKKNQIGKSLENLKEAPQATKEQKAATAEADKAAQKIAEEKKLAAIKLTEDEIRKLDEEIKTAIEEKNQAPLDKLISDKLDTLIAKKKALETRLDTMKESLSHLTRMKKAAEDFKEDVKKTNLLKAVLKRKGLLSIAGTAISCIISLIAGILGEEATLHYKQTISEEEKTIGEEAKYLNIDLDKGVSLPNPNPQAPANDADYNKTLSDVAALFADINQKSKTALELYIRSTANETFKIAVGKVNVDGKDVPVNIEYDFSQEGYDDVGQPLTPFWVTLSPTNIRGFAITPDDIIKTITQDKAKILTTTLLYPPATLIFAIKFIQMVNTTTKNKPKGDVEKDTAQLEYILDQATVLFYRLMLTSEKDATPTALISTLPATIQDIFKEKKVDIYSKLIETADSPIDEQKTAFERVESVFEEGSLIDALPILYNNSYQILNRKFNGDYGYQSLEKNLGPRAAKNQILAIFYRGLKGISVAAQKLLAPEGPVTLRYLNKKEILLNPGAKIDEMLTKPEAELEKTSEKLNSAAIAIKKMVTQAQAAKQTVDRSSFASAQKAYDNAIQDVKAANQRASEQLIKFRSMYAPYYPLAWYDGTSKTTAEFLTLAIQELKQHSKFATNDLINEIYSQFQRDLGLTGTQLMSLTDKPAIAIPAHKTSTGSPTPGKAVVTSIPEEATATIPAD